MSNTLTDNIPVFGERTDLYERPILYPEWLKQLPTDNIPEQTLMIAQYPIQSGQDNNLQNQCRKQLNKK
jgi:hypothetical protein